MKEVNDLLNRLGKLEEAPLIWVNKKVYNMAEEIERLNNIINTFEEWLETEERKCKNYETNDYDGGYFDAIDTIIVKLKELKGENNG